MRLLARYLLRVFPFFRRGESKRCSKESSGVAREREPPENYTMYQRGNVEASDDARVAANDYYEQCDQRTQIECDVVNIFAEPAPADEGEPANRRRLLRLWKIAAAHWCVFCASIALLPVLDSPSDQIMLAIVGTTFGGSIVAFVCWRIRSWALEELPRHLRRVTPRA